MSAGTVTPEHFTHTWQERVSQRKEREHCLLFVIQCPSQHHLDGWQPRPPAVIAYAYTHTHTFITPLILKLCHGAACPSQRSSPSLCICKTEGGGEDRCWMLIFDSINSSATAHVSSSCQLWAYAVVSPLAHGQLLTLSSEWYSSTPAFFRNDGLGFYKIS